MGNGIGAAAAAAAVVTAAAATLSYRGASSFRSARRRRLNARGRARLIREEWTFSRPRRDRETRATRGRGEEGKGGRANPKKNGRARGDGDVRTETETGPFSFVRQRAACGSSYRRPSSLAFVRSPPTIPRARSPPPPTPEFGQDRRPRVTREPESAPHPNVFRDDSAHLSAFPPEIARR